jgi:hypothetical protein
MKMRFIVLAVFVSLVSLSAAGAESPILASHSMTGSRMAADSVVLNYTLTVKNTGENAVSGLVLTYVPLFIPSAERISVDIKSLGSQAEIQVPLTVVTPLLLDQNAILRQPLFWAGEYTDGDGNRIEVPVRSIEGGAL